MRGVRPENSSISHIYSIHVALQIQIATCLYKPGFERPRGGELAAEDCLLDGYHGVIDMWASIRDFVGEVAPEINFGVAVVDIRLGEAEVDIILGVASGVRRGVMCDEMAYFWIGGLVAVPNRCSTMQNGWKFVAILLSIKMNNKW